MKKILLIDDRKERQTKFTADTGIDLEEYSNILDNITGEDYHEYVEKLSQKDFELEHEVIIVHRSAFGETDINILDRLKNYCQSKHKKLIFFSGGISSTFYLKEPFEFLLVNSKVFYSNNLKIFLDDSLNSNINIVKIGYGNKWKLNIMLDVLEKINLFISNGNNYNHEDMTRYSTFQDKSQILLIDEYIRYKEPELKNGGVTKSNLTKLSEDISNQIKKQVILDV